MKHSVLFCAVLLPLLICRSYSQGGHMLIEGTLKSSRLGLAPSHDGGFWLFGNRYTAGGGNLHMSLGRFDANGDMKMWRLLEGNTINALLELPDGTLLLAGASGYPVTNAYLVRADSTGQPVWIRVSPYVVGGPANQLVDVDTTLQGHPVVFGEVDERLMLAELSPDGDALWTRAFWFSDHVTVATSLHATSDGGFYLCGFRLNAGKAEVIVMKCGPEGDLVWARSYAASSFIYPSSTILLEGDRLLIAADMGKTVLMEIDAAGQQRFQTSLGLSGGSLQVPFIASTSDDGYVIAALNGGRYVSLIWLNSAYGVVRAKSYGDGQLGVQLPLVLPYAGGFVGAAVSSANDGFTPYLFLADSEGRTGCSEYEREATVLSSGAAITVTDITEEVQTGTTENLQPSTGSVYEEEIVRNMLCESVSVEEAKADGFSTFGGTVLVRGGDVWEIPTASLSAPGSLHLYDAAGQLRAVIDREELTMSSDGRVRVGPNDVGPGVYLLTAHYPERIVTHKLLVR